MSHIYGLVVICHANVYRGDGVIVLPKFEFASTLQAIQDYKINSLFLVSRSVLGSNCADQLGATDHYPDG
jgi:beta-N-acetylglucosaminidase